MEVKRLYNKELRFLAISITAISILLATITYVVMLKNRDNEFEKHLTNNNFSELYSYIGNPDFTRDMFKAYTDYNFGSGLEIINKAEKEDTIEYKVKTIQGEKLLVLKKVDGKRLWNFNDYIYDWHFNVPQGANVKVQGKVVENNNGQVVVDKIPAAIYDLEVDMENCEPYSEKIMAGQNITIKLSLSEAALNKGKAAIEEYLRFKENAFNNKTIEEIDCIDRNSGLFTEVVDELEWLKTVDFKAVKNLLSLDIKGGAINDGTLTIEAIETWVVKINNEGNDSEKTEIYNNLYTLTPGNKLMINHIQTNK